MTRREQNREEVQASWQRLKKRPLLKKLLLLKLPPKKPLRLKRLLLKKHRQQKSLPLKRRLRNRPRAKPWPTALSLQRPSPLRWSLARMA